RFSLASAFKSAYPQFAGIFIISILCLLSLSFFKTPAAKLLSFFYIFMRFSQTLAEGSAALSHIRFNFDNFVDLYLWSKRFNKRGTHNSISENKEDLLKSAPLKLTANNLSFSYDKDKVLFSGLNFKVLEGETL